MRRFSTVLVCIIGFVTTVYLFIAFILPFQIPLLPSSTIYLDQGGQEIGEVIYSGSIRHREMVFEEIPEFTIRSLIALEDRTFYNNNGVSLR